MTSLYSNRIELFPGAEEDRTPFPHSTEVGSGISTPVMVPSCRRRKRAVSELQCCRSRATGTVHFSSPPGVLASASQRSRSTCWGLSSGSLLGSLAPDDAVSSDAWLTRVALDIENVSICLHARVCGGSRVREKVGAGGRDVRFLVLLFLAAGAASSSVDASTAAIILPRR